MGGRVEDLALERTLLGRSLEGFSPEFRIRGRHFTTWKLFPDCKPSRNFGLCLPVLYYRLLVRHFIGFFLK